MNGIKASVIFNNDIEIIAEASSGNELFKQLENYLPDIIILDIILIDQNGIEICKILKEEYPDIRVIIFTGSEKRNSIFDALKAGANAYLPKDCPPEELIEAIYSVKKGKSFISNSISNTLIIDYINKENSINAKDNPTLSEREMQVLKLVVDGLPYKIIADRLFITPKTVEKHKRNILRKLQLDSVVDLVKFAIKNKIIDI